MSASKLLKDRANEAFKAKEFENAVELYNQAITIEESSQSKDSKLLSLICSNLAQTYLELKQYEKAIVSADLSLSHDPTFTKSVIRRAVAKSALGKLVEETADLLELLKLEPKNLKALDLVRQIAPSEKMSNSFRFAFVGYRLRRATFRGHSSFIPEKQVNFRLAILRVMFLSSDMSRVTKYFWNDGSLTYPDNDSELIYYFGSWFISKNFFCGSIGCIFASAFTREAIDAVFALVQPNGVCLIISPLSDPTQRLLSMYKFDKIYALTFSLNRAKKDISCFQHSLKHVTVLPCLDEIMRFPNTTFPYVDMLYFFDTASLSLDFFKFWEQRDWPVKSIFIEKGEISDCRVFERVSDSIRAKVKSIQCGLQSANDSVMFGDLQPVYAELNTLKRLFPSLTEFIGKFALIFNDQRAISRFFSHDLKTHIRYLVTEIDAEKIRLCKKPKIVSSVSFFSDIFGVLKQSLKDIKRVVKECRQEMPNVELITFSQSKKSFGFEAMAHAYGVIDIEANGIQFQVALTATTLNSV